MANDPATAGAEPALVALGYIAGTHALRGEVRIRLHNRDSTALDEADSVVLRHRDGRLERRTILEIRPHQRFLLARLEGCRSIDDAEPLVGTEICLPENELPELAADEVYHFQLVGMDVHTVDGRALGRVAEVMDLPAHDVCVVRDGSREFLIPFVDEIVREVDVDARRLVIDPLPGLLDD